jgi:hypothetical protein
VRTVGSEGLKDQRPRSCAEWLVDSHGTREMLNDANIPLGQEPWELSVSKWPAYAAGELQRTFGNEVAFSIYFHNVYIFKISL